MPKTINFEKLKSMFEKATIPDAIENYDALGKYLHEKIQAEADLKIKEAQSLKAIQEKLNNK